MMPTVTIDRPDGVTQTFHPYAIQSTMTYGACESCSHQPAVVQVTVGADEPFCVCWGCAP